MTRVLLDNISKTYPGVAPSVAGLTLNIAEGELFTLLGPSGCGKSTTLRMVAGFVQPTGGRILFDDTDVTNAAPNRRNTGMVFQNYALFPHLTVAGNVSYGLNARKVTAAQKHSRIDTALSQVGLDGYGDRRIDMLSGGQQQRVALARALVIRPSVLLLDEPLSNLDAKLREETRTEIRATQKEAGITCLYVTHDQAEAMSMSDRIAVLEAGEVHQVASPRDVYHRPATAFVARFIGRSNVFTSEVVAIESHTVVVRLGEGTIVKAPIVADTASASATVGMTTAVSLRPEAISLTVNPVTVGSHELTGRVLTAEFTGAVNIYEVDWHGQTLVVSVPGALDRADPGDTVAMAPAQGLVWMVHP
ncbi:ABC transporter ATP-binding protein [Cryobacterium aureum]|uniref:ABC transporter ATP-binding protein n=1 Tax=Cryobacterium aureum TaxID=995037 RepID=UPI000CF52AC5|nr:ABC transporter ATP-binding protein [Cryobacterium aureum]